MKLEELHDHIYYHTLIYIFIVPAFRESEGR